MSDQERTVAIGMVDFICFFGALVFIGIMLQGIRAELKRIADAVSAEHVSTSSGGER